MRGLGAGLLGWGANPRASRSLGASSQPQTSEAVSPSVEWAERGAGMEGRGAVRPPLGASQEKSDRPPTHGVSISLGFVPELGMPTSPEPSPAEINQFFL